MLQVVYDGIREMTCFGLVQYDYGQILHVKGIEGSPDEVHFWCRGMKNAYKVPAESEESGIAAKIPDELITKGEQIVAYIYVTDETSGKTVYTVNLPVIRRAKPENYVEPEHRDLLKELEKKISEKADNISLQDGWLQLMSAGKGIGDRIRMESEFGEIELKNTGEEIAWRYTNSNEWITLAKMEDLRGRDGTTPEFEIRDGHLFALYED